MANEVRFTIRLNVDGQSKVVDATASVDDLMDAIEDVRETANSVGQSKGWETRKSWGRWNWSEETNFPIVNCVIPVDS